MHENYVYFDFSEKTQFDRPSSLLCQREDFRTGIYFFNLCIRIYQIGFIDKKLNS